MCPVSVNLRLPLARSQILTVLSPAPVQNHWFLGSTATARTHPKWPDITRISFQGACQTGLICGTVFDRMVRLLDGRFRCAVPAPAAPALAPPPGAEGRKARAVDAPPAAFAPLDGIPSINFMVPASAPSAAPTSGLAVVGGTPPRIRPLFKAPAAAACLVARACGSSRTSSYSA
jgi:hypothetical protein